MIFYNINKSNASCMKHESYILRFFKGNSSVYSWVKTKLNISVSKLHEAFTIQCSIAVWNHYMNNNARSAKMSLNIKALKKFNVIFRYIQFHCANPNLKKKILFALYRIHNFIDRHYSEWSMNAQNKQYKFFIKLM